MNKHYIIKKLFIYTFFFSLIFTCVYFIKDNVTKQNEVKETIASLFNVWNEQDKDAIYEISNEKEAFEYVTGFENNEVITDIIETHIYEGPEYTFDDIVIEGIGHRNAKASAQINLTTYNNMEVLNTIINELLNDNSKVTKDYKHEEFVAHNQDSIKEATKNIKKESKKTVIIYLECEDGKWSIPYRNNIEFYDALSGGMISFSNTVDTNVDL